MHQSNNQSNYFIVRLKVDDQRAGYIGWPKKSSGGRTRSR